MSAKPESNPPCSHKPSLFARVLGRRPAPPASLTDQALMGLTATAEIDRDAFLRPERGTVPPPDRDSLLRDATDTARLLATEADTSNRLALKARLIGIRTRLLELEPGSPPDATNDPVPEPPRPTIAPAAEHDYRDDGQHGLETGRWEFTREIAARFEDMLRRSIPDYPMMRHLIDAIVSKEHTPDDLIVDLGCGDGSGIKNLVRDLPEQVQFVLCDNSMPMLAQIRRRFAAEIARNPERITAQQIDLRTEYPDLDGLTADLTLCVLTAQFVPVENRHELFRTMRERTRKLVLVEKILGSNASDESFLTRLYYQEKRRAGYSEEEINAKRQALSGVLVPWTIEQNRDALYQAGFVEVREFWRCLNFVGWYCEVE